MLVELRQNLDGDLLCATGSQHCIDARKVAHKANVYDAASHRQDFARFL
jgi:hypothetical protein